MAILIEGLVSREPIQEKNSSPSKRYRLINGTTPSHFCQEGNPFPTPQLFLAMQDLGGRFGSEVPFVTRASKESSLLVVNGADFVVGSARDFIDSIETPVKGISRTAAPAAAVTLLALACTSPAPVVDIQNPTGNPDGKQPAQQTLPCEPEKELEKFAASIGVPTPVPRGMEGAPTDIVAIRKKMDACQDLTPAEKDALIAFNVKAQAEAATGPDAAETPASKPNTPEAKTECFINDDEACKTARMVKIGDKEYVALQVKPGISLITRLDGEKTVTEAPSPLQGVRIAIGNRNTTETETIIGNVGAEIKPLWVPITNGTPVGITQGGEIYVRFTKVIPSAGGIVMDKERTEKAFPGILQKPIEELTSASLKPSIAYIYQP